MTPNQTRYGRRKDKNHNEVRDALRAAGYHVIETYTGFGVPDLQACTKHHPIPYPVYIEVKQPGEKLTPLELEFFDSYPGIVVSVESGQEAVEIMSDLDCVIQIQKVIKNSD